MRDDKPLEFHDSAQERYVPKTCNGCRRNLELILIHIAQSTSHTSMSKKIKCKECQANI